MTNVVQQQAEDDIDDQPSGVDVTRPYEAAVIAAHVSACLLIMAGVAEAIVGAALFAEWENIGSFWIGLMAFSTGAAGSCVSTTKNSGGPYTAWFCLSCILCVIASLLSLKLGDGVAHAHLQEAQGNCFDTSTCTSSVCEDSDCVCWEPDDSNTCDGGTTKRYCFNFNGGGDCDELADSEPLLLVSTVLLTVVYATASVSTLICFSLCCCFRRKITLRRRDVDVTANSA